MIEKPKETEKKLIEFINKQLIEKEYKEIPKNNKLFFEDRNNLKGKQFAKNVLVGKNIYGRDRRVSFVVFNTSLFKESLIIECRWQESSGSVEQKYPYFVANINKTGVPSIILIDGDGYNTEAMEWLCSQVSLNKPLIGVYNLAQMKSKINDGFF